MYTSRKVVKSNVIAFPATKTAGAVTLSSEVFNLPTLGKAQLVLKCADRSKITNNLTIKVLGSFDGANFTTIGSYTDLANGGAAVITALKEVKYMNYLKVQAVFDGTGALASGHGIVVDLVMVENADEFSDKTFAPSEVVVVPATVGAAVTTTGKTLSAPEGQVIDKIRLVATLDNTKATLVTIKVQGSMDGTYWYDVTSTDENITDAAINFSETSTFIGKYARVNVITGASTGALTSGHGTALYVQALY